MPLLPCPACRKKVSTEATVCPHCGHPLAEDPAFQKTCEDLKRASKPVGAFLGLVVLAVVGIVGVSIAFSGSRRDARATVGSDVQLRTGADMLPVCVTRDDFNEYLKTSEAEDHIGQAALLASGRVFTVDEGTNARVLELSWTVRRVRILDGPHAGKAGWVPNEWAR